MMNDELELRDEPQARPKAAAPKVVKEQPKPALPDEPVKPVVPEKPVEPVEVLEVPAPAPLSALESLMKRHDAENRALRILGQYAECGVMEHEARMKRLKAEHPAVHAAYLAI